jgi:hypothetical protein
MTDKPDKKVEAQKTNWREFLEPWFQDHFPNSPISRVPEAWGLLLKAKEDLIERLTNKHL